MTIGASVNYLLSMTRVLKMTNKILLFTSPTCGPCMMMKPAMADLANEHKDNYDYEVIDTHTDEGSALATRYRVRAVPTTVLLQDNNEVGFIVGAKPKDIMKNILFSSGFITQ